MNQLLVEGYKNIVTKNYSVKIGTSAWLEITEFIQVNENTKYGPNGKPEDGYCTWTTISLNERCAVVRSQVLLPSLIEEVKAALVELLAKM